MEKKQWPIIILVGLGLLVVVLLVRKQDKPAPAAAIPLTTNKVSTGASILNTLIATAGSTASAIFGKGSDGGSGGYSYAYTDSSLRLGGG
jgi:hypothetical protein